MALINKVLLKQYNLSADAAYCKIGNVSFDYKQDLAFVLVHVWASKEAKIARMAPVSSDQIQLPISVIDKSLHGTYIGKIYDTMKAISPEYTNAIDDSDELPTVDAA